MRERDVPQEGNATLAGHRKGVYAIADDDKLRLVPSRGWEVEEIVTRQAVEDLKGGAGVGGVDVSWGGSAPREYQWSRARLEGDFVRQGTGMGPWPCRA